MGEIIAALPFLLYASVVLFWAAAMQWTLSLHCTVGYVVIGSTALTVGFYLATTLLAAASISAPFRTPLSNGLYWTFQPMLATYRSFRLLSGTEWFHRALILISILFNIALISTVIVYIVRRSSGWTDSNAIIMMVVLSVASLIFTIPLWIIEGHAQALTKQCIALVPKWITKQFFPWVKVQWQSFTRTSPSTILRTRDEMAINDPQLNQQLVTWLAQQLPITTDSNPRFLLLFNYAFGGLPKSHLLPVPTLNSLGGEYMKKILEDMLTEGDYEVIYALIHYNRTPVVEGHVRPSTEYVDDPSTDEYWRQYRFRAWSISSSPAKSHKNMAFLLARDVPLPSAASKSEMMTTIELIRWRNSEGAEMNDACRAISNRIGE